MAGNNHESKRDAGVCVRPTPTNRVRLGERAQPPGRGRTRFPSLVWTRVSPSTVMSNLLDDLQVLNPNSTRSSTLNFFPY